MISNFLAFLSGNKSRKRSQISSACDEANHHRAKRQKSDIKQHKWGRFAGMAEWMVHKKLSFSDTFYHRSKDDADPMTTMPSSQCDPLVARSHEFLPATGRMPASRNVYSSGYQFPSLPSSTVLSGNRFKFGNTTDVQFKAPLSRQNTTGSRHEPVIRGSKRGPNVSSKLQGVRRGHLFLQRQKNKIKLAAKESIRLEERNQYAELLHHYSTILADPTSLSSVASRCKADASAFRSSYFDQTSANATAHQTTVLGSNITHRESSTREYGTPRPSHTPAKSTERVIPSRLQKYVPVKSRGDTPRRSTTPKDPPIVSSPHKRRNTYIYEEASWIPEKTEVIDLDSGSDENKDNDVEIVEVKKTWMRPPKSPAASFFEKSLEGTKFVTDQWVKDFHTRYATTDRLRCKQIEEEKARLGYYSGKRGEWEDQLSERIERKLSITQRIPAVLVEDEYVEIISSSSEEEEESEEEEKADEFPELSEEQDEEVDVALRGRSPDAVLSEAFRLQITRRDMATLQGLNWLNDEIINFYMNLLMDRGSKPPEDGGTGFTVHAFNTFFYPKLMGAGHAGIRRWTRKIDVLAVDYILVPVHLGMHWCLAVVDFGKKAIRYFDSMGGNNNACLNSLREYLVAESLDKKKEDYDVSGWQLVNVKDIPHQMNGSDCGMFSCKYAEYVTRDAQITFTQEHMPYFRRRMVYEILTKTLM